MKRVVLFALMLILSLAISAQDLYYMYGKQRIPLQTKGNSLVLMVHNTDGIFDLINENMEKFITNYLRLTVSFPLKFLIKKYSTM